MKDEAQGNNRIPEERIAACAAGAVTSIDGVHSLTGGFTENLSVNLLGLDPGNRGIKVARSDEGLSLDIHLIVDYMVKIPQLAWDIQGAVKRQIETELGLSVKEVHIHVQGVYVPEGETETV